MENQLKEYYLNDAEKEALNEKVNLLINEVEEELKNVSTDDVNASITQLFKIQKLLIPSLLNELKNPVNSLFKTRVLDRLNTFIKTSLDTIIKLKEFEIKEDVDFTNPKIQLSFGWFIEVIAESLDDLNIDKPRFFELFSSKLQGWEDKCSKKLSKMSLKSLQQAENIKNPFLIHQNIE